MTTMQLINRQIHRTSFIPENKRGLVLYILDDEANGIENVSNLVQCISNVWNLITSHNLFSINDYEEWKKL